MDQNLSKKEIKKLKLQRLQEETERARIEALSRQDALEGHQEVTTKSKKKKKFFVVSLVGVVIILIAVFAFSSFAKPGPYDQFAKCLTEKGAVMYGADWCKFTQGQKSMFGNSMKYVDYRDFSDGSNIKVTPTWIINGERYEKTQSFDKLATVTGCTI